MDARCLREIRIRAGMAAILVAVFTLFLGFDARFWLLPPAVAALIWLKWRFAPPDDGPSAGCDDD